MTMRCERCQGGGRVLPGRGSPSYALCPDCNGCGVVHCCDGLREQPEEAKDGDAR